MLARSVLRSATIFFLTLQIIHCSFWWKSKKGKIPNVSKDTEESEESHHDAEWAQTYMKRLKGDIYDEENENPAESFQQPYEDHHNHEYSNYDDNVQHHNPNFWYDSEQHTEEPHQETYEGNRRYDTYDSASEQSSSNSQLSSLPKGYKKYLKYITNDFPAYAQENHDLNLPGLISTDGFIARDGNCQFRALSYLRYENAEYYQHVRAEIITWLRNHSDFDDSMVLISEQERSDHYNSYSSTTSDRETLREEYITRMEKDGEWGDQITLAVAGKFFERPIIVLSLESSPMYFTKYGGAQVQAPALLLKGQHYELLFRNKS